MDKTSTGPAEYPDNLSELTSYFTLPPINPYTGKSMVSDNPEESGLQYTNNGSTYTLTVVQLDVDDINKNGKTTEPLPVALNVGGETETPTVTKDTEPPTILAATLTGTVDGEYREYDVIPIYGVNTIPIRTVTVSVNDTAAMPGMILSITATDNAGISQVMMSAHYIFGTPDYLIFDETSGTWQYIFHNMYSGTYTMSAIIIDVNGNTQFLSFRLVVTE